MALSDEHRLIRDTVAEVLDQAVSAQAAWAQLADLGILGLLLPEDQGGSGLGLAELALIARALGHTPLPLPWLGSEAMALPLLAELAPGHPAIDAARTGKMPLALAATDRDRPVEAVADGRGWRLGGTKTLVLGAGIAGAFVVAATLDDAPAVFLVPDGAAGLQVLAYAATGLGPAGDLHLDGVVVDHAACLARGPAAEAALDRARCRSLMAIAAEMVGGIDELLDLTTDYLRTRRQFGMPLSGFQALQHAATEIYVEAELARSMLDYGLTMASAAPAARDLALAAVKLRINVAARIASETAVQLHGGIGMTTEAKCGRIFARLAALRLLEGDEASCRRRLIDSEARLIA